ncbi:hypothetical protein SISSUDRAFT_1053166 [Sistotremastrum suecicum HHB10207 ss-3]|uniref:Uncharacterized protein n=1 Tax=Sistotremastrum suecicum HHB10207 ss-3 TaxID=1314776 RepID=A0A165ZDM1_9AGAM|nr:hypothetical protein SISSUDRAFT_1053166 [Sistotremastrum suecicum HHB10207 ss-3]
MANQGHQRPGVVPEPETDVKGAFETTLNSLVDKFDKLLHLIEDQNKELKDHGEKLETLRTDALKSWSDLVNHA